MKEMKENKEYLAERIDIALKHCYETKSILEDILNGLREEQKEEPKDNKVKVTIKVKNPYDGVELDDKELEQIRKDLEEIINDFTRE